MNDYDLSFLSQRRPLANLIEDPYDRKVRELTLADLAQQRDLHALNIDDIRRKQEDSDAIGKAYSAMTMAGWSPEAVRNAIGTSGRAAPAVAKSVSEYQKAEGEREEKKAQTALHVTSAKSKALEGLAGVAAGEARDPKPDSLDRLYSAAKFYNYELPSFRGDTNDRDAVTNYLTGIRNLSYKAHEQETDRLTADRDAATTADRKATREQTGAYQTAQIRQHELDRGQRAQAARDVNDRMRDANEATRDTVRENKLNAETHALSKQVDGVSLPSLLTSGNALDDKMAKYTGADIPGVGQTGYLPAFMLSGEGKSMRATVQAVSNDLLKLYSGGAVTLNEAQRRAVEMMSSGQFTDDDMREAWPLVKGRIDAATQNVRAGYSPQAIETYEARGGVKLRPIGSHRPVYTSKEGTVREKK